MDLLSSIRKSGSRGGVNFSWDEVQTSQHRENYLGHSLMAPVGRWQKGKDLSWYAKGDEKVGENGETAEERKIRERKEEIRKIKEAEEDALARALGLPVADRNVTGANAITVGEVNRMVKEVGVGEDVEGDDGVGRGKGFGDFVGNVEGREGMDRIIDEDKKGGLVKKGRERERDRDRDNRRKDGNRERRSSRERRHKQHRHCPRSAERRRHRSRSGERHRGHDREEREARISRRSHSPERRERKYRSRSPVGRIRDRDDRSRDRPRRSRSPASRDYRRRRFS